MYPILCESGCVRVRVRVRIACVRKTVCKDDRMHTYMCACTERKMVSCIHVRTHVCMYLNGRLSMVSASKSEGGTPKLIKCWNNVCVYCMCVCIHVYICICIYIYIYIYTYI